MSKFHGRPPEFRRPGIGENLFQAFKKVLPALSVSKNFPMLDSPDYDVVEKAGSGLTVGTLLTLNILPLLYIVTERWRSGPKTG